MEDSDSLLIIIILLTCPAFGRAIPNMPLSFHAFLLPIISPFLQIFFIWLIHFSRDLPRSRFHCTFLLFCNDSNGSVMDLEILLLSIISYLKTVCTKDKYIERKVFLGRYERRIILRKLLHIRRRAVVGRFPAFQPGGPGLILGGVRHFNFCPGIGCVSFVFCLVSSPAEALTWHVLTTHSGKLALV